MEAKSATHEPKAAKRLAMERPASKKHAAPARHTASKLASAKHVSLPASHSSLKKHARETNHAKSKAASTKRAPTAVARRDGKPLNLLPR